MSIDISLGEETPTPTPTPDRIELTVILSPRISSTRIIMLPEGFTHHPEVFTVMDDLLSELEAIAESVLIKHFPNHKKP